MNHRVLTVSAVLIISLGLRIWLGATPTISVHKPLAGFPHRLGSWELIGEEVITDPVLEVLRADDYLLRKYRNSSGQPAELLIAYYAVQRAGESMHSPKNCLPGWGWRPVENDYVVLGRDSKGHSIQVNRYVIEKNGQRALVLYWYQAQRRVVTSEYWGKIWLVWDAVRWGRRDGALIRITVPMGTMGDSAQASNAASELARASFPFLRHFVTD